MVITSTKNESLKLFRSLQTKKGRKESGLYSVEGVNILKSVPENFKAEMLFIRESDYEKLSFLEKTLNKEAALVSNKIFDSLCDTVTPIGAAACFGIPSEKPVSGDTVLLLCSLSDAGNVGTIIRTAAARGVNTILTYGDCADCYSPKAVRASMGGIFHTNIVKVNEKEIEELKKTYKLAALDMNGANINDFKKERKLIIAVGSEAHGLPQFIKETCDYILSIPMTDRMESLNAAVSASLALYLID